jgi:stearoyl-CoA desaturase (Delta-9 desaturase)
MEIRDHPLDGATRWKLRPDPTKVQCSVRPGMLRIPARLAVMEAAVTTGKPTIIRGEAAWMTRIRVFERHVGVVLALVLMPPNASLLILCAASYAVRMFAAEGIYHRYFAHRSYQAGRIVQLLLGLIGAQCGQRGPLWWSDTHRQHHRYTESPDDPHSPVSHSFWYSFVGWYVDPKFTDTHLEKVPDLARFPELLWLDRWFLVPYYAGAILIATAGYAGWLGTNVGALGALLWGFYVPACLANYATAAVNAFGHSTRVPGWYRRFATPDQSVNRPLLALITFGMGWHNNHHRYAAPARAGFAWYEVDVAYALLRVLLAIRLIREMKMEIPEDVLRDGHLTR